MAEAQSRQRSLRILVLNPNSSTSMTNGMAAAIRKLPLSDSVEISTYTAPPSVPGSIDGQQDIDDSAKAVLDDADLTRDLESDKYDAVLVACFSVHPLVAQLGKYQHLAVTGIFEASITTALSLSPAPLNGEKWAIVTTGKFWEDHLADGVKDFFGQSSATDNSKFAGVYSTGLLAGDFHSISAEDIRAKLEAATTKIFASGNVSRVVLGCGGMAGLEDAIRTTAIAVYGKAKGEQVYIIDGVKAGVLQLEQTIRSKRAFR
ncbi:Protein dcg1 [Neonectria punicea]|uniref:Protein dcg1 n=1 Tax=Neonectria punicea TaxID=979145 RepID=A0ABR1GQE4_9HYPO